MILHGAEAFRFDGRTRRPPLSPVNALLSFVYALVRHDCESALEAVGLDPAVGYLHVGLSPRDVLHPSRGPCQPFPALEGSMFDHEKLHVYQLQLEFLQWVTPLLEEAQRQDAGKTTEIRKHLDQASLSVLLNIAEGNGRRGQQTRAKFFDDAPRFRIGERRLSGCASGKTGLLS